MTAGSLINLLAAAALALWVSHASGEIVFVDDFEAGPSPLWAGEVGAWCAVGGEYSASVPNMFPNSYSSLPFELRDFSIEVDIRGVAKCSVWLRCSPSTKGAYGLSGVQLVFDDSRLFWVGVRGSAVRGAPESLVRDAYVPGSDLHIRIDVVGDSYVVYLNGSKRPVSRFSTADFEVGRVALWDGSTQVFDNVVLHVPPLATVDAVPPDLDGSGSVDDRDLGRLLGAWGTAAADLTGDGTTDRADIERLMEDLCAP